MKLYVFFFKCTGPHRDLHSSPTRRSSDLGGIADTDLTPLQPEAPLTAVTRYFATYNLVCGPVVDAENHLLGRSEEHTSELQSQSNLVCRLLLEKKNKHNYNHDHVHIYHQH